MKAVIQRTSDLKISKELIYEVLNIPKENIVDIYIDGKYLLIKKDNNRIEEHNIYEFAFKCKEWALNKDYVISTYSKYTLDGYNCTIYCNNGKIDEYFTPDTEIEAIIEACKWILIEGTK
ncbi:hypothetical protein NG767_02965 [Aliarcobacter cryaerophilus]|uniref:hypothetical protein n=1 Tax=Aliarcobacter cryaerophilus TaxID=28198 RepID=UPI003DA576AC